MSRTALVIGGGPAGLMAADVLARGGLSVTLIDAKPSMGRKFLMAGKSGLNLTKDEPRAAFIARYGASADWLAPMLHAFGPNEVQAFARDLGQEVFTGSSGRVFPKVMKASPMLRAWLARLDGLGVRRQTKTRWLGWTETGHRLSTGAHSADVTVFALGGASWARLGSDGTWAPPFMEAGIPLAPFAPSNAALNVAWSAPMAKHFGAPLKAVKFTSGDTQSRGEAILSAQGLEGGGIYTLSPAIRAGHALTLDLKPDWPHAKLAAALAKPQGKTSLSSHLRKQAKLSPVQIALLHEWVRPLPRDPDRLAALIKALPIQHLGLQDMDSAISTAGGVAREALTDGLMLHAKPGQFCAGEMLDWDAPTGGYLLTACMATGLWAAQNALNWSP